MYRTVALALCLLCAACDAADTPAARAERKRQEELAWRDPDKRLNMYSCVWNSVSGSGGFTNYAARFGGNMRIDTYHADGTETWVVEQWAALPGSDRVVRRVYLRFKDDVLVERRLERVDPDWRDDC